MSLTKSPWIFPPLQLIHVVLGLYRVHTGIIQMIPCCQIMSQKLFSNNHLAQPCLDGAHDNNLY